MFGRNKALADSMIDRVLIELRSGSSVDMSLKSVGVNRGSRWHKTLIAHPRWSEVQQEILNKSHKRGVKTWYQSGTK